MKDADLGEFLRTRVYRLDDFRHLADVGLGFGDNDGVAGLVGSDGGLVRDQRLQVFHQLHHLYKTHWNDLRDDLVSDGNLFRVAALDDGNVLRFGLIAIDNGDGAAIADGSQAVLVQDRVQQIHRLFTAERFVTPDIHLAFHRRARLHVDDVTRGLAQ